MGRLTWVLVCFSMIACSFEWGGTDESVIRFNLGLNSRSLSGRNLPPLESIVVIVESPDAPMVRREFSIDESNVSVRAPSGRQRTITVRLPVANGAATNVLAFGAKKTLDLYPRQEVALDLFVQPLETQYLVADPGKHYQASNGTPRILVMNGLPGSLGNWQSITNTSFTPTFPIANYRPVSLDFDKDGRIYFGTDVDYSTTGRIHRAEELKPTNTAIQQLTYVSGRIVALAIDRKKDLLYYLNLYPSPALYKVDITNLTNNPIIVVNDTDTDITFAPYPLLDYANSYDSRTLVRYPVGRAGLAVDQEGMIYLVGGTTGDLLIKFDPNLSMGSRILAQRSISNLALPNVAAHPWTIMDFKVIDDLVYVLAQTAVQARGPGNNWGSLLVFRADNLSLIKRTLYNPSGESPRTSDKDKLASPRRFAAVIGKKLMVIEDGGTDGYVFSPIFFDMFNRLVLIDPADGSYLGALPENGDTGVFSFFSNFYNC